MTARTNRARITRVTVIAVACLAASVLPAVSAAAPAGAAKAPAPHYYLALGDWLATGIGASQSANDYVNLVAAHEATRYPNLQAVNLGVGARRPPRWPTVRAARTRPVPSSVTPLPSCRPIRGQVAFVTIDIGADDIAACQSSSGTRPNLRRRPRSTDLDRSAAGTDRASRRPAPGVPIYGMNYYDPFLAAWLTGTVGPGVSPRRASPAPIS